MIRISILLLALLASGCATKALPPIEDPACATEGKPLDGGIGGTGHRPEHCPPPE